MLRRLMTGLLADRSGYSLIVVAMLFAAFAVLATVIIDRNMAAQQIDRQKATREQLTRISEALIKYHYFKDRLPCPAAANVALGTAAFGEPFGTNCVGGTGNLEPLIGGEVVRGMVPIRALVPYGISDQDAFDAWNDRIMYVVNRNLTPSGSATIGTPMTYSDVTLGKTLATPQFLLISYGRDREGAYSKNSTSYSIGCTSGNRSENCNSDRNFLTGALFTASTAGNSGYFDDIVTAVSGLQFPTTSVCDNDSSNGLYPGAKYCANILFNENCPQYRTNMAPIYANTCPCSISMCFNNNVSSVAGSVPSDHSACGPGLNFPINNNCVDYYTCKCN